MPLGDNSALYTSNVQRNDASANGDIRTGAVGVSDAYKFGGTNGDDRILGFEARDSIVNDKAIFDGNGDGFIQFGSNGVLDIDRVTARNPGADQITVGGLASNELRFLGSKSGAFVYADSATLKQLGSGVTEGTVGNNTFDASTGAETYLYDTALGFNLGGDTITGFGSDDRLVTTSAIYNGPDAGFLITVGNNGVLDLPGSQGGLTGDNGQANGGQIDFGSTTVQFELLSTTVGANGATYYTYGLADAAL